MLFSLNWRSSLQYATHSNTRSHADGDGAARQEAGLLIRSNLGLGVLSKDTSICGSASWATAAHITCQPLQECNLLLHITVHTIYWLINCVWIHQQRWMTQISLALRSALAMTSQLSSRSPGNGQWLLRFLHTVYWRHKKKKKKNPSHLLLTRLFTLASMENDRFPS